MCLTKFFPSQCICNPPIYNMSCPSHKWYFEEMRKPQLVCDNSLANWRDESDLKIESSGRLFTGNRKTRRKAGQKHGSKGIR